MQAVVSIALMLLAVVPSLQPFYTPQDQITDQKIEGSWRAEDQIWLIVRTPERSDYTLSINDGRGGFYTATLFRIGSVQYVDLKLQDLKLIEDEFVAQHFIRTHSLLRVEVSSDTLRVTPMDGAKLSALLAQQSGLVPHVSIERNDLKSQLVLTGSTAQLKSLVKAQSDRIFTNPIRFQRSGLNDQPSPLPTAAPPEKLSGLTSQGEGHPINSAQAAVRAARVANDFAEKQFGVRPFLPRHWTPRFENNHWYWGEHDQSVRGYSAEIKMNNDGSEPDVKIYFETPAASPGAAPTEVPEVPAPAPIVPR